MMNSTLTPGNKGGQHKNAAFLPRCWDSWVSDHCIMRSSGGRVVRTPAVILSAIYTELQPWLNVRRQCVTPLWAGLTPTKTSIYLSLLLCYLVWLILIGSCTQRCSVFQMKMPLITECNNTLAFSFSKIMDLTHFANGLVAQTSITFRHQLGFSQWTILSGEYSVSQVQQCWASSALSSWVPRDLHLPLCSIPRGGDWMPRLKTKNLSRHGWQKHSPPHLVWKGWSHPTSNGLCDTGQRALITLWCLS